MSDDFGQLAAALLQQLLPENEGPHPSRENGKAKPDLRLLKKRNASVRIVVRLVWAKLSKEGDSLSPPRSGIYDARKGTFGLKMDEYKQAKHSSARTCAAT